jgi:hypothetical protein
MIETAEQMYVYFLKLINKEKTHTVIPSVFNFLINVYVINWVKGKLPTSEYNQRMVDDLQVLLVDGELTNGILPIAESVFSVPLDYMHGISALFDLNCVGSPCYPDGLKSKLTGVLLKSANKNTIFSSFYRRPKDSRLYFRYSQNKIRLFTGKDSGTSNSYGSKLYLDYYRLPNKIEYVYNGVSTNSEFKASQQQEIVERAAQEYLENNRDPRYQSFLNEQVQRNRM